MKSLKTPSSNPSQLWELFIVKEDGSWAGFRIGLRSLRKLSNYLVLILCLLALSVVGWMFARWKMFKLEKQLTNTQLELNAVRHDYEGLRKVLMAAEGPSGHFPETLFPANDKDASILPTLDGGDRFSALLDLNSLAVKFQTLSKQLNLDFSLSRLPPKEGKLKVFWILMIHGPQGIISFPKAFASRSGEALLFHRGEALELSKPTREVAAQFRLEGFIERSGSDPVYATLLVYDEKGSLLSRYRRPLEIIQ